MEEPHRHLQRVTETYYHVLPFTPTADWKKSGLWSKCRWVTVSQESRPLLWVSEDKEDDLLPQAG